MCWSKKNSNQSPWRDEGMILRQLPSSVQYGSLPFSVTTYVYKLSRVCRSQVVLPRGHLIINYKRSKETRSHRAPRRNSKEILAHVPMEPHMFNHFHTHFSGGWMMQAGVFWQKNTRASRWWKNAVCFPKKKSGRGWEEIWPHNLPSLDLYKMCWSNPEGSSKSLPMGF